ncbi:MAG TPA: 3'-5' exonuclease, partial [Nitrososphaeraceae archaeon]|nr:3'-5' exonuclease [Nitrososphaeraceae archaeon]
MFQAIHYDRLAKEYYIRDDKFGWKKEKYYPKYYYLDENGDIPTLDGNYCRQINRVSDWYDPNLLEKDVDKLTRYLVDHYYEDDNPPSFQNIGYLDIETEIVGALTTETIKAAPMGITSIALFDQSNNKKYCWILDKEQNIQITSQDNVEVIPCKDERELLELFLDKWEECEFTIVIGWNSGFFDIPVLYYRIIKILGYDNALRLSPIKKIIINEMDEEQPVVLGGLNHLDYML